MSLLHFSLLSLISSRVSTWMSTRTMAIGWSLLSLSFRNVTLLIPFLMLVTRIVHWALKLSWPLRLSAWEAKSFQEGQRYVWSPHIGGTWGRQGSCSELHVPSDHFPWRCGCKRKTIVCKRVRFQRTKTQTIRWNIFRLDNWLAGFRWMQQNFFELS